jgi:hypothetical protein
MLFRRSNLHEQWVGFTENVSGVECGGVETNLKPEKADGNRCLIFVARLPLL